MSEPAERPRLADGAVVADLPAGEVMVATRDGDKALLLNETGAIVVRLCTGSVSVAQMAALFAESLGVEAQLAERDIRGVLAQLAAEGLLAPVDSHEDLDL